MMERKTTAEKRTEATRTLLALRLCGAAIVMSCVSLLLQPKEAQTPTEPPATLAETTAPTEPVTEPPTEAGPAKDDPLLLLVNASHPLPENYEPELTRLRDWDLSVAAVCYDDLRTMIGAGLSEGLSFQIASAYRTYEEQQKLFDADVKARMDEGMTEEEAKKETARYTSEPGYSEHETGYALDIVSMSNQRLDDTQEETAETRWLHAHAWEYGFILRYPKDKEDITGIAYESWHYRYVGKEAAAYLHQNDLTLEEYLQ